MSSDRTCAEEGLFSAPREGESFLVEAEPRLGVMEPLLGEGDFVREEGGMGDLERERVLLDGGLMVIFGVLGCKEVKE